MKGREARPPVKTRHRVPGRAPRAPPRPRGTDATGARQPAPTHGCIQCTSHGTSWPCSVTADHVLHTANAQRATDASWKVRKH